MEDRGSLGVKGRRLYRVQLDEQLGEASRFEMPENELEATSPPVRLSYEVQYARPDDSKVWHATTKKGRIVKGVKATGAVGYTTTGFYNGETPDDQRYAAVLVLLEVDSRLADEESQIPHELSDELAKSAEAFADEMFLARHPRARISRSK